MKFFYSLIIFFLAYGSLNGQTLGDTYAKKISKQLGKWSEEYSDLEFLKNQDKREFYRLKSSDDNFLGYLVISSASGRYEKFDLMTVIREGEIKLIRILKYRSQFGAEVTNKKWLSQFYTTPDSTFVFRKNIDAISGATFSTQGLIHEINNILGIIARENW